MNDDAKDRTIDESRRPVAWTTAACLALALLGCDGQAMQAEDTAAAAGPDMKARQAFSGANHPDVTSTALTSRYNIISVLALTDKSTIGDDGIDDEDDPDYDNLQYRDSKIYSQTHFDNCYWNEGVQWVNDNMARAAFAAPLFHRSGRSDFERHQVFKYLGFALHATQDFYAHSNWVESHIDPVTHVNPIVACDFAAGKPDGWFSGTYGNDGDKRDNGDPNPGEPHCPPDHRVPHGNEWFGLNKDTSSRPGFAAAEADAKIATKNLVDAFIGSLRALSPDSEVILKELGFKHFDVTFIRKDESTPIGYYKNPTDLNKGAGGDFIYLCTKGDAQSAPLTVISGSSPNISCPSHHPVKLSTDLNWGAGGDYIYFCATNAYAGNVKVVAGDVKDVSCGDDNFARIDLDLNRGAHGKYIYLCIKPMGGNGLTIGGRVTTAQGVAVPGITVTLAGSHEGTAVTDGAGYYFLGEYPPGSYSVRPSGSCAFSPDVVNLNNLNSSVTQDFIASRCRVW
jgi:hypothetical protein